MPITIRRQSHAASLDVGMNLKTPRARTPRLGVSSSTLRRGQSPRITVASVSKDAPRQALSGRSTSDTKVRRLSKSTRSLGSAKSLKHVKRKAKNDSASSPLLASSLTKQTASRASVHKQEKAKSTFLPSYISYENIQEDVAGDEEEDLTEEFLKEDELNHPFITTEVEKTADETPAFTKLPYRDLRQSYFMRQKNNVIKNVSGINRRVVYAPVMPNYQNYMRKQPHQNESTAMKRDSSTNSLASLSSHASDISSTLSLNSKVLQSGTSDDIGSSLDSITKGIIREQTAKSTKKIGPHISSFYNDHDIDLNDSIPPSKRLHAKLASGNQTTQLKSSQNSVRSSHLSMNLLVTKKTNFHVKSSYAIPKPKSHRTKMMIQSYHRRLTNPHPQNVRAINKPSNSIDTPAKGKKVKPTRARVEFTSNQHRSIASRNKLATSSNLGTNLLPAVLKKQMKGSKLVTIKKGNSTAITNAKSYSKTHEDPWDIRKTLKKSSPSCPSQLNEESAQDPFNPSKPNSMVKTNTRCTGEGPSTLKRTKSHAAILQHSEFRSDAPVRDSPAVVAAKEEAARKSRRMAKLREKLMPIPSDQRETRSIKQEKQLAIIDDILRRFEARKLSHLISRERLESAILTPEDIPLERCIKEYMKYQRPDDFWENIWQNIDKEALQMELLLDGHDSKKVDKVESENPLSDPQLPSTESLVALNPVLHSVKRRISFIVPSASDPDGGIQTQKFPFTPPSPMSAQNHSPTPNIAAQMLFRPEAPSSTGSANTKNEESLFDRVKKASARVQTWWTQREYQGLRSKWVEKTDLKRSMSAPSTPRLSSSLRHRRKPDGFIFELPTKQMEETCFVNSKMKIKGKQRINGGKKETPLGGEANFNWFPSRPLSAGSGRPNRRLHRVFPHLQPSSNTPSSMGNSSSRPSSSNHYVQPTLPKYRPGWLA